jgi:hypothetical protein
MAEKARDCTIGIRVDRRALILRIAAGVVLAGLVAGGFEPMYVRIFSMDSERWRAAMTELPYRKLPGFRRLLLEVDRSTPQKARIAIALPFRAWEGGYGYGYYRASYLLPGRQVVPLLVPDRDEPQPGNVALADYLVVWHGRLQVPGFTVVWTTPDGTLLRRAP